VVVDPETVRVLSPNGGDAAHVDLELPLAEIQSARTETLVGGGALIAARGTDTVEIVRFTTPLHGRMGSVARTLDALAKDEEPPASGDATDDEKRVCPTCGRPLPPDNDVCRFCIDKSAVLARLFSYAAPHKWKAVALVLLMFAGTAMALAPGVIVKDLTDRVPAGSRAPASPPRARPLRAARAARRGADRHAGAGSAPDDRARPAVGLAVGADHLSHPNPALRAAAVARACPTTTSGRPAP
jgi:hypothetical protein